MTAVFADQPLVRSPAQSNRYVTLDQFRGIGALWVMLSAAGLMGLMLLRMFSGYVGGGFAWRAAPSGFARGLFYFSAGMLITRLRRGRRFESNVAWVPVIGAAIFMSIDPPHPVAYDLAVIILVIPLITHSSIRLEPPNNNHMRIFGDLSYSIYASRSVAFFALVGLAGPSEERPLGAVIGVAVFSAFLVCCWSFDRYFDRPIRAYASSMLKRQVGRAGAP